MLFVNVFGCYALKFNKTFVLNVVTSPNTFLSLYLSMLANGIIFGRQRRNSFPGYLQGLPCAPAFSATTQNPTVMAQHSFHKPASTETFSTCLHLWACRLPSTSCKYCLKERDGLKASAGIDLSGVCKTDSLKVAPQGLSTPWNCCSCISLWVGGNKRQWTSTGGILAFVLPTWNSQCVGLT